MLDSFAWPLVLNVSGLLLTLIGVILLFIFGMPYRVRTGGHTIRLTQPDPLAAKTERRFDIFGRIGLGSIAVGTILQIIAAFGANAAPQPTVVIDGWWNADYAKEVCRGVDVWAKQNKELIKRVGCENVNSCPEMTAQVEACVGDPVSEVRNFERELTTQLAINTDCVGVRIVNFSDPAHTRKPVQDALNDKQHWGFMLDYTPGAKTQSWSMVGPHTVLNGEGTSNEIAARVCKIANQRGAKVSE